MIDFDAGNLGMQRFGAFLPLLLHTTPEPVFLGEEFRGHGLEDRMHDDFARIRGRHAEHAVGATGLGREEGSYPWGIMEEEWADFFSELFVSMVSCGLVINGGLTRLCLRCLWRRRF